MFSVVKNNYENGIFTEMESEKNYIVKINYVNDLWICIISSLTMFHSFHLNFTCLFFYFGMVLQNTLSKRKNYEIIYYFLNWKYDSKQNNELDYIWVTSFFWNEVTISSKFKFVLFKKEKIIFRNISSMLLELIGSLNIHRCKPQWSWNFEFILFLFFINSLTKHSKK